MNYRIVYFLPDPFMGAQVPVAVTLLHNGKVTLIRYPYVCHHCLEQRGLAVIKIGLEDIEREGRYNSLPASCGPQFALGKNRVVPEGVEDPVAWLKSVMQ